jgi:hypothetical protein
VDSRRLRRLPLGTPLGVLQPFVCGGAGSENRNICWRATADIRQ